MKNLIILGLIVFGVCFVNTLNVYAEDGDGPKKEKKAKKAKKEQPQMEEMTITGKITKAEKKGKGDKVSVAYTLTDAAGNKISLPTPKAPKKGKKEGEAPAAEAAVINLEEFVDANVTLVGKGYSKEAKGKKRIYIKTIEKIEKAAE